MATMVSSRHVRLAKLVTFADRMIGSSALWSNLSGSLINIDPKPDTVRVSSVAAPLLRTMMSPTPIFASILTVSI